MCRREKYHRLSKFQHMNHKALSIDPIHGSVLLEHDSLACLALSDAGAVLLCPVAQAGEEAYDGRGEASLHYY